jgi:hypothetical protein
MSNGRIKVAGLASDGGTPFAELGRVRAIQCDREGNAYARTESGNTPISQQNLVLADHVKGSAVNTNIWTYATSGMTIAQAGGAITLNNAGATTADAYATLKTIKHVPFFGEFPVEIDLGIKINTLPIANLTIEWGLGDPTGKDAITNGIFWRYNAADQTIRLVCVFNGEENVSEPVLHNPEDEEPHIPEPDEFWDWDLQIDNDEVRGNISGSEAINGELETPLSQPYPVQNDRLPVFLRIYNHATPPAVAGKIHLGRMAVSQLVVNQNRPWAHTLILAGRSIYQSPDTPFGQTAQWANSAAPDAASLSNTVPAYVTLGGIFRFAAVAGANTDYALFGFQVPAGKQLVLGGCAISTVVTGADIGASATVLAWALGLNASAASLATAESPPATWAPKRIALGLQGFQKNIVQGEQAAQIERVFDPPLVVDGGRYVHIILRIPEGLATGSQVFYGTVTFNGYFD